MSKIDLSSTGDLTIRFSKPILKLPIKTLAEEKKLRQRNLEEKQMKIDDAIKVSVGD